jgi:hypothetical protein
MTGEAENDDVVQCGGPMISAEEFVAEVDADEPETGGAA